MPGIKPTNLVVGALLLGLAAGAGGAWWWLMSAHETRSGFVGRQGRAFVRFSEPFRPIGVNFYSAAGDPAIFVCGPHHDDPDTDIDEAFRRIREETGASVVRFWAFQSYTAGGTDWRAFDRVVRLARKHDLLLLPVLENQWADCTHGGPRDASWYAGRFRQPDDGYLLAYEAYVRAVVTRYRDEPAIFAWMLMNEAESKRQDGSADPEALRAFADTMSRIVKSIAPHQLVALGVIGRGQPGTVAPDFERLHALPAVDLVTYHDYLADAAPLPGARLDVAGFIQGQDWSWQNGPYASLRGQTWETVEYRVAGTSGAPAPRRIGLTLFGDFGGDLYVDEIRLGARTFDFEDGTTQGWQADGPISVEPTTARSAGGRHALRIRVSAPEGGAQLWLTPPADLGPGATLSARLFLETPGTAPRASTLAAALATAAGLETPLLVSEAGLATCSAPPGSLVNTPAERAARFDAKIDAFFRAGGAGYLVWSWHPATSCGYEFSSGDPLNGVLRGWAGRLTPR